MHAFTIRNVTCSYMFEVLRWRVQVIPQKLVANPTYTIQVCAAHVVFKINNIDVFNHCILITSKLTDVAALTSL